LKSRRIMYYIYIYIYINYNYNGIDYT